MATTTFPQETEILKSLPSTSVIPQNVKPVMNEYVAKKDLTTTAVTTESTLDMIDVEPKKDLLDEPSPPSTVNEKQDSQPGQSKPDRLPDINIFLMQRCNIPLIRCDYSSALKAADTHRKKIKSPNVNSSSAPALASPTPSDEIALLGTSGRTHTVINYRQFLEEFADAPPSPPKRKTDIDLLLKRRPSKERIAAEKHKSKITTKATSAPKPVYNKRPRKNILSTPKIESTTKPTIPEQEAAETNTADKMLLTPATTTETRDAIEALLLLSELPPINQVPDDDNSVLVPVGGGYQAGTNTDQSDIIMPLLPLTSEEGTIGEALSAKDRPPKHSSNNKETHALPLPGTVLGTSTKIDTGSDANINDNVEPKVQPKPKSKPAPVKKELSFEHYGIKRKYKAVRTFKCKQCPAAMPSVQEYNKHYLDCHLPQTCPDCTKVFTSPRTLAKHCYTHAEYMYECQDCNRGFRFKSQLESRRKVHIKISGYVCFKPKCGKHFKRESELNAHLTAHSKNKIKCDHCNYSNSDIQNVRAHSKVHSDKLP